MRMNRKIISISVLIISFAAITACGTGQQLTIESDPSGAEVYLMRRGEYEVNASIDGQENKKYCEYPDHVKPFLFM